MNKNKAPLKSAHTKKQLKKELEVKMESALPEIKTTLGEKKFHRRIKKAAKIMVQGLHNKDIAAKNGNATEPQIADKKDSKKIKTKAKEALSKPVANA